MSKKNLRTLTQYIVNRKDKNYVGHELELKGQTILLGVDFKSRDTSDALRNGDWIASLIDRLSIAKSAVVVIDACRDNPFARGIFSLRKSAFQQT